MICGFNTQPPEGGWSRGIRQFLPMNCFNTQPPEGGWEEIGKLTVRRQRFQHTAARRRLEYISKHINSRLPVSTHSRPKAAGSTSYKKSTTALVSTHSRPKAAGMFCFKLVAKFISGFNTQPPEGGWRSENTVQKKTCKFQHTAARRRLDRERL